MPLWLRFAFISAPLWIRLCAVWLRFGSLCFHSAIIDLSVPFVPLLLHIRSAFLRIFLLFLLDTRPPTGYSYNCMRVLAPVWFRFSSALDPLWLCFSSALGSVSFRNRSALVPLCICFNSALALLWLCFSSAFGSFPFRFRSASVRFGSALAPLRIHFGYAFPPPSNPISYRFGSGLLPLRLRFGSACAPFGSALARSALTLLAKLLKTVSKTSDNEHWYQNFW